MPVMWQTIIKEIKLASGLTQPEIANKCGCGQTTISELETGKTGDPRYTLGKSLLSLHRKHCGKRTKTPCKEVAT